MILVSYVQPFDMYQKIYVLDESTKDTVEEVPCKLSHFDETIINLINTYNAKKLQLHGPEKYCLKMKQNIDGMQILKYNKKKLSVEIL